MTEPTNEIPESLDPSAAPADTTLADLLDEDAEDLYDHAPCGYLSTRMDGTIVKINATLLRWLGHNRDEVVGHRRFSDLLTVGGRIYHETHLAPLLQMQGEVGGVALDLHTAGGARMPVLLTSVVKRGTGGHALLIRTTVFDAHDRRAYEKELLHARQVAEHERERLQHLVVGLQRSLLPETLPTPPGMQTAASYHMASPDEVGGDFYDLFQLTDGRWAFFLGDVCGKGVRAASVTAKARYTLRAAAVYDPSPSAALTNLNSVLCQDSDTGTGEFCTVIFGVLTPTATGYRADIAGGGHPSALLLRADGTADFQPTTGGTLIGVLRDVTIVTRSIALQSGDTLLLYTDGLTEARTPTGRFGAEALRALAASLAPTTAAQIIATLTELLNTLHEGIDDDTALLALTATGPVHPPV